MTTIAEQLLSRAETHREAMADQAAAAAPLADAKRRRKEGTESRADAARLDQNEAAKIGAKVREREAAREVVSTALALGRTDDAAYLMPKMIGGQPTGEDIDARAVLADAESAAAGTGRMVGRWQVIRRHRMTAVEAAALIRQAARAALKVERIRRLPDEDYIDLTGALWARLWQRATEVEGRMTATDGAAAVLPLWTSSYGSGEAASLAAAALGRRMTEDERDRAASLWRGTLADHGRDWLKGWRERTNVERSPDERRRERSAAAAARGGARADEIGTALADGGRPLAKLEAAALAAALDGMTHRERAEVEGITQDHAKANAAKGRKALGRRWPDAQAARADFQAAAQAARSECGYLHPDTGVYHAGDTGRTLRAVAALRWIEAAPVAGRPRKLAEWPEREDTREPAALNEPPTLERRHGAGTHRPAERHGGSFMAALWAAAPGIMAAAVAPLHAPPYAPPAPPLRVTYPVGAGSVLRTEPVPRKRTARRPAPISATEHYDTARRNKSVMRTPAAAARQAERMRALALAAAREVA